MVSDSQRNYHHGSLRNSLLRYGLEFVREHGLENLSLRQISAAAGVSSGAAYRHFKDQQGFITELAQLARETQTRRWYEQLKQSEQKLTPTEAIAKLRTLIDALITAPLEDPRLHQLALSPKALAPKRPDSPDSWTIVNGIMDELVEAGVMSAERRAGAGWLVWSTTHGYALLMSSTLLPEIPNEKQLRAEIVAGLVRSLTSFH